MMRWLILWVALFSSMPGISAQNVGLGTTSPESRLHIKGSQNISQLTIDADSSQTNTSPLVRLRSSIGTDVLWIHSDSVTNLFLGVNAGRFNNGTINTFVGHEAGSKNTTGHNNTAFGSGALKNNNIGIRNTAIGSRSLGNNTSGDFNTSIGSGAMLLNTTGSSNVAVGELALSDNTSGIENVAIGLNALYLNTTGNRNTAVGKNAMVDNREGNDNTAVGIEALKNSNTGSGHTAIGAYALLIAEGSVGNTAVGFEAAKDFDPGNNATFLGAGADANANDFQNSTAIGASTTITASNQIRIGSGVTSIGGPANWTNTSDARIKQNVRADVPGLSFINVLEPVTYTKSLSLEREIIGRNDLPPLTPDNTYETIRYSGFLAQDVEQAALSIGYDFSGLDAPKNPKDLYGLRYAEFVVPLVKAVQELSTMNQIAQVEIAQLKQANQAILLRLHAMEATLQGY